MATIFTKADIVVHIDSASSSISDGLKHRVRETGFTSESEQVAINHALAYLAKLVRHRLRVLNHQRPKGSPVLISLPKPVFKLKRRRTIPPRPKRIRTKFG